MTKILVTGGKGFLGQHIVSRLRQEGKNVRVFARPHPDASQKKNNDGAEVVHGDIRDPEAVEIAVRGVDRVIHLVSNFRKGGSDKNEAYDVNVTGTENVLNACLAAGVERLVHCSTIGVHGNVKEIPASENTPFNPGDLYQETKLIAEKKVWDFYREKGLPVSVVRPISLFGPGDLRMLKLFRMIKKGRFVIVGDGQTYFQPAYIDDVVDGFMLCLEKEEALGEVFIIGDEEYLPLNELFRVIADELGVSPPRIRVPMSPMLALAWMCEQICVPLGIEPPLHRRRVSFFQNDRAFSVKKAKRLLDFQPRVSLREGIQQTIHWYQENGWL